MMTLAINKLVYHKHSPPWWDLALRLITKRDSGIRYHITEIDFLCRERIKVGKVIEINGIDFTVTACVSYIGKWHIIASADHVAKKKPKKQDFYYTPINKFPTSTFA